MKYNILYVDDEEINLSGFKLLFRKRFNIVTASSGKQGLEILKGQPIQVIVTDQRMPDMNGLDFLKKVKGKWPNIKYILLTAYDDLDVLKEAINEVGIFWYVDKPFEPDQMEQIIQNAIVAYQVENKLKESEEKFRTLVTSTEEIIFIIANDRTFLLSEGKGLTKLGLKSGEVVGMSVFDLYKDSPLMLDKMRLAFNGETVIMEHEVGDIYFKSWYTPHLNQKGDIIGLLGLSVNITEQKKAANDILEYQNRLKALTNELILAEENQRLEIATGLHDNVGTLLAASRLQIAALNNTLDKEDILDKLNLISNGFLKAIESTRSVIFELSPPTLNEFGLSAALSDWMDKELDAKYGIKYKISSDNKKYQINKALRSLIFRCSRELLINVIKHARASLVKVNIQEKNEKLTISIHDNGSGFSYNPGQLQFKKLGFGLFSIQERIDSLGGEMLIDTAIGEGTKIVLKVPVNN